MNDISRQWPADSVERWPVEKLVPYARNARTHSEEQIEQIAESLQRYGWTMPVLAAEDGSIIAGHGRVLAATRLGYTEVPVMTARGWSDAQRRAYALADNKLALNAAWDEELIAAELTELSALDVGVIGFSDKELERYLSFNPDGTPPKEFVGFDASIETEHRCPKCGYEWSGKSA